MADSDASNERNRHEFEFMLDSRENAETRKKAWDASSSFQLNAILNSFPDLDNEYQLSSERRPLLPPAMPPPAMPTTTGPSRQHSLMNPVEEECEEDEEGKGWMKEALHQIEQGDIGSWLDEKLLEKGSESSGEDKGGGQKAGPSQLTTRRAGAGQSGRQQQQSSGETTGIRNSSRVRTKSRRSSSAEIDEFDLGLGDDPMDLLSETDEDDEPRGEGDKGDEGTKEGPKVTLEASMALVHLPIRKAATHLGFKTTSAFKSALVRIGVHYWPYRQYACLRNLLATLRADKSCYGFMESQRKGVIKQVKEEFSKLTQAPNEYALPSNLKAVSRSISFGKHQKSRMGSNMKQKAQDLATHDLGEIFNNLVKKKEAQRQSLSLATAASLATSSFATSTMTPAASLGQIAPPTGYALPQQPPNVAPQQPHAAMQQMLAFSLHSQIENQILLLQSQQQRILNSSGLIPFLSEPFAGASSLSLPPPGPTPLGATTQQGGQAPGAGSIPQQEPPPAPAPAPDPTQAWYNPFL